MGVVLRDVKPENIWLTVAGKLKLADFGLAVRIATAAKSFEVVVFAAGLEAYVSLVLDRLDPEGDLISHRLYRVSCKEMEGGKFVKNLAATGLEPGRVAIVDANPNAYAMQPAIAVPVVPFMDDLGDEELKRVMKFLGMAVVFDDARVITMYANCRQIDDSKQVFDEVGDRNAVSWTALVTGFGVNGRHEVALDEYKMMIVSGISPNQSTFTSALNSGCGLEAIDMGRKFSAEEKGKSKLVIEKDRWSLDLKEVELDDDRMLAEEVATIWKMDGLQVNMEFNQIFITLLDGSTRCLQFPSPTVSGDVLKRHLSSLTGIPASVLCLVTGSLNVHDDTHLSASAGFFPSCTLLLRLRAGKGGFRGASQKKAYNFDACQDLSGRRIR